MFLDKSGRLRTIWRFAIFFIGFFAIQAVVGIAAAIGYLAATGALQDLLKNPDLVSQSLVEIQMIAAIPLVAATVGLTLLCRRYLDWRSVASMGLVRPGRGLFDSVAGGLLFGTGLVLFAVGILWVTGALVWEGVSASLQTALLVPVLAAMAFFEEMTCRGYLLQNLVDIRRPVFGVVFTSLVFWILHSFNPAAWSSPIVAVNLFAAGVTLALAYLLSGNIWFPTALHFAWNFTQGVLFQLPISGIPADGLLDVRVSPESPTWLTGGDFGIEGSVLCTVAEVALSVVFGTILLKRGSARAEAASALPSDAAGNLDIEPELTPPLDS